MLPGKKISLRAAAIGRSSRCVRLTQRHGARFELLEERAVLAAPDAWSARGIGGGGALFSPSLNPTDVNEMYVASDMSQVFHTTDQGATWQEVDFRELQGSHNARVQFTNDPLVRYSLDYSHDLIHPSKSVDGGVTWTPLAADPTAGEAYALIVDYNNPSRVLVSDYTHLYFSSNGGASFSQKYLTADSDGGLHIAGVFFDGQSIYVGTSKGLLVSTNGGGSFVLSGNSGIPATEALVSFAGAKQNGTTRFFGVTLGAGDVFPGVGGEDHGEYQSIYSLDYGVGNWTAKTSGIPSGAHPFYVSMAAGDISTVYVAGGSSAGTPSVYKSTNGGTSWQNVFLTTNNQNIATGWSGAGGDRGWGYGEFAEGFQVSPANANRLIITDLGFAHYSDDGGAHWRALNVNPADRNPEGAPTPTGREYRTSGLDNDTSWGVFWADQTHMIGAYSDIQGIISDDGGATWSLGYTGHTLNSLYRAVTAPSGTVYAATASVHDMYQSTRLTDSIIDAGMGKVIFSANKGVAWTTLHDFGAPVVWVALDPNNPSRLYASVADSVTGGIYVSSDIQNGGSSTWTKLATPPRTEGHAFNIVVIDDGATSTLVASFSGRRNSAGAFTASSGVFVSTDGGSSWIDRSDPGMYYWTKDIVVDPHDAAQNTWYAGVFSGWGGPPNGLGGLYKTTDRGVHWTKINDIDRVTSVTINPTNANEMYLTTEVEGLWISENATAAAPTFSPVASYPFRQPERVFFNPYNPSEIWVTSFGNTLRVGTVASAASVQGRQIFYNNSKFDGNNAAANASDDGAIASDKAALLPNTAATFVNYSSYSRGINGLAVDIAGGGANLSAADFTFRIGNTLTPASWASAPAPQSVVVRAGAGAGGANRVMLTWADGAIKNTWLQVTVKANANTGLAQPDVFYFGNAIGESGTTAGSAQVNSTDELAARNSPRTFMNPALVSNAFDFNRDGLVNATDQLVARSNATTVATALKLLTFPASLAAADDSTDDLSEIAAGLVLRRHLDLAAEAARQPVQPGVITQPQSIPQPIAPLSPPTIAGDSLLVDEFGLPHAPPAADLPSGLDDDLIELLVGL